MATRKSKWLAAIAACMFAFENKSQDLGMYHNPDYRVKQPKRNLQSFIINGKTIEAYSRKDAIKRLKHNK